MKNKNTKPKQGLKKDTRESQREEMQLILHQVELPVIDKFSNEKLDRANEIAFISGDVYTWKELAEAHLKYKKFINAKLRDWQLTFKEELYRQWRRLNGWDMDSKSRPMIFAAYTVRDIYGSLPKEIYPTIEELNDYLYPGIRMYRYCQLLTEECHEEVREIIKTAIKFAKSSKDIYEYRVKLASVYGTPFSKSVCQLDAFRDNDEILNSI